MVTRGIVNGAAFSQSSTQLAHQRASALKLRLTFQPLGHSRLRHLCHRKLPRLGDSRSLFILLMWQLNLNNVRHAIPSFDTLFDFTTRFISVNWCGLYDLIFL